VCVTKAVEKKKGYVRYSGKLKFVKREKGKSYPEVLDGSCCLPPTPSSGNFLQHVVSGIIACSHNWKFKILREKRKAVAVL